MCIWGELLHFVFLLSFNPKDTRKYIPFFFLNITEHLEAFSSAERQKEIPLVLKRFACRPEIYIHGCKWSCSFPSQPSMWGERTDYAPALWVARNAIQQRRSIAPSGAGATVPPVRVSWEEWTSEPRESFQPASTSPQPGETNGKINTHTQDSSLQGPFSTPLSVRVGPSSEVGWEALTRKVSGHTDHAVRERLRSCSAPWTAPDRQRRRVGENCCFPRSLSIIHHSFETLNILGAWNEFIAGTFIYITIFSAWTGWTKPFSNLCICASWPCNWQDQSELCLFYHETWSSNNIHTTGSYTIYLTLYVLPSKPAS